MLPSGRAVVMLHLAALAPAAVPAQQQPPVEVFRDQVRVSEVVLDVVVTDRDDRVIVGLGPADFVVTEEGSDQPVALRSVSFYSSKRLLELQEAVARPAGALDVVPRDRHFVVFVQEQPVQRTSRPSLLDRQLKAGRQLVSWLTDVVQPADRVAVVSYGRWLKVHHDFTTDRPALIAAIEAACRGRDPAKMPPSRRSTAEVDPPALSRLPTGKELQRASRDIYRALTLVADAVAPVAGRKNLIFVGRGFGDIGSFGDYQPERFKLEPMIQALNDANVAVYAVDVTPPERTYNLQIALRDLAAETGGRFYYDRINYHASLAEISDLTSGYYLLSYESRRPADAAGYQRVSVATRNPELRIQARQGYLYGPPAP